MDTYRLEIKDFRATEVGLPKNLESLYMAKSDMPK